MGQVKSHWRAGDCPLLESDLEAYLGTEKVDWFTHVSKFADKTSSTHPLLVVSSVGHKQAVIEIKDNKTLPFLLNFPWK